MGIAISLSPFFKQIKTKLKMKKLNVTLEVLETKALVTIAPSLTACGATGSPISNPDGTWSMEIVTACSCSCCSA